MDDGNLAILVDAKTEYTKQLVNIISPNIFIGIQSIYNKCKELEDSDTLYKFQVELSEIPKWNQEVINEYCEQLVDNTKCDWLEDLLTAVFVSHTRILTSINSNKNKNKINLKIPRVDHFIHLCYIEVARAFWKNPYLFDDNISKFEYLRNRRDAEVIINNTINETIRKQLPVKHILKEYLGNEFKEGNDEIVDTLEKENLRKMVKAEIENCSKEKLDKLNINKELDETEVSKDEVDETNKEEDKEALEAKQPDETKQPDEAKQADEAKQPDEAKQADEAKADEAKQADEAKADEAKADEAKVDMLSTTNLNENISISVEEQPVENGKLENINLDSTTLDKVNLDPTSLDKDELQVESLVDDDLKVENLNLNIDNDLSSLEEIYIDEPQLEEAFLEETKPAVSLNEPKVLVEEPKVLVEEPKIETQENTIKTVFIDTDVKTKGKPKQKPKVAETDMELNMSDSEDESMKIKRRKDYSFFE